MLRVPVPTDIVPLLQFPLHVTPIDLAFSSSSSIIWTEVAQRVPLRVAAEYMQ